ncbi:VOC family protein [Lentzea sp.]|uniref:VOC family protein n=1 Tax=Lentzea sp. TaxID=56099 RepID=UPI002ED32502
MLIDHLVYAAPDLDTAVAGIEARFGVRAAGGGQHLGQGTHNRLLALGPRTYLEIVAPDPRQPEPASPRPYGVDGVREPGLVGWALQTDDIERVADLGGVIDGQRLTVDGQLLRWRLTANALTAGVVPFFISWGDTPSPALSAPAGLTLESVRVEHPDPRGFAGRLRELGADVDVRTGPAPALVATISGPNGRHDLR